MKAVAETTCFPYGIAGVWAGGVSCFLEKSDNKSISPAVLVSTFKAYGLAPHYWGAEISPDTGVKES